MKASTTCAAAKPGSAGAAADVAIAGVRPVRLDPEQDELARLGHACGLPDRRDEARPVLDDMVRRHHHQNACRVLAGDEQRGGGGGRRGVARHRFQHHRARRHAGALGLLLDEEAVVVVADDDRPGKAIVGSQALQRGGEKARPLVVEGADELLGVHGPRQRPKAGARAAGQNDGIDGVHAQ